MCHHPRLRPRPEPGETPEASPARFQRGQAYREELRQKGKEKKSKGKGDKDKGKGKGDWMRR